MDGRFTMGQRVVFEYCGEERYGTVVGHELVDRSSQRRPGQWYVIAAGPDWYQIHESAVRPVDRPAVPIGDDVIYGAVA